MTGAEGSHPAARVPREEIARLETVVAQLVEHYDGAVPEKEIYQLVFENYAALRRAATVLDHLVPLTAHLVGEQLRERVAGRRED